MTMISQNYEKEWKEVDADMAKQLPKSALQKVEKIYKSAVEIQNDPQIIKSLLFLAKLKSETEETDYDTKESKEILFLESKLSGLEFPNNAIMQSLLADKYANYIQRNHWRLANVTSATDESSQDLTTFSIEKLHSKAYELYWQSLKYPNAEAIELKKYDALVLHSDSRYIKNLYDYLNYRALSFFANEANYLKQPSYKFSLVAQAFSPVEEFVTLKTVSKDTFSYKYNTIKLFQDVLSKHLNDVDKSILIDMDLRRLEFVRNNYFGQDKNEWYESALTKLYQKLKEQDESGYIAMALAQNKVSQYYENQQSDSTKGNFKKAVEIYSELIQQSKNKNIKNDATNHYNNIVKDVNLSFVTERIYLPNKPLLVHLEYKNIDKVYYKIIKLENTINRDFFSDYRSSSENKMKKILAKNALYTGNIDLKNPKDYLSHSTECALPSLPLGKYAIVFSIENDFSLQNNIIQATDVSVSNLGTILVNNPNLDHSECFVIDREKGTPVANAKVTLYSQSNSYNEDISYSIHSTDKTNSEGKILIKNSSNDRGKIISVENGEDHLIENSQVISFYHNDFQENQISTQYQLFLDRAIYRPSQVVYFKGIAYEKSTVKDPTVLSKHTVSVELRDNNGQTIETKDLVTNEYGTFHSTFTTPSTGLLGEMSIIVNGNFVKSFRLEEYKRPTFEILFDTIQKAYSLGDSVLIKGKGMAFSGAPIAMAKVNYHVRRKVEYPYWKCWWRPIPHQDEEIAFGAVSTDQKGVFEIPFEVSIDKNSEKNQFPIYNYQILVDMVDVSGETHSQVYDMRIGTISLEVQIETASEQYKNTPSIIDISTKNLNGNDENAVGTLEIIKLIDPTILYQNRYWKTPDLPIMSEQEFRKNFPLMPYNSEDNIRNFKEKGLIYSEKFESKNKSSWNLDNSKWEQGAYKVIVTTQDKNRQPIKVESYFTLLGTSNNLFQAPMMVKDIKDNYEPNQTTQIFIEKMNHQGPILTTIESKSKKMTTAWNKPNQPIKIAVSEGDKGGISMNLVTVMNNRYYEMSKMIPVNYLDKELDIEYLKFRDKLEPGQEEEWQLKIKSKKGDKFMAEVLTNMYDQSLDEFVAHEYQFYPFDNYYPRYNVFSNSFGDKYVQINHFNKQREAMLKVEYKLYPSWRYSQIYTQMLYKRSVMSKSMTMSSSTVAMAASVSEFKSDESMVALDSVASNANPLEEKLKSELGKSNAQVKKEDLSQVKVRTNLNETVFFYPNLYTDNEGNVLVKFKMNEALTKWKFMALATTKDMKIGISEKSILTQKSLIITPNAPRFLRENDQFSFTAKVSNMTNEAMDGVAELQLFDALTMKPLDSLFQLGATQVPFKLAQNSTTPIQWNLQVPTYTNPILYRVIAKSKNYGDGEQNILPVLSNKMLVTESIPLNLRSLQTKSFEFKSMLEKINSPTLKNVQYKLEFTSNPVWLAVQSMPYLMEYPHDCIEQLFSKYYANSLSASIIDKFPKIKMVFDKWKGTDAMKSPLSKNQELKTALLEETPWLMEAQSEEVQRNNMALLFDLNTLANEERHTIDRLAERQNSDGSWSWFPGGMPDYYMTQYLVEGFGHLDALKVKSIQNQPKVKEIVNKAVHFIDNYIVTHYNELERQVKRSKGSMNDNHLDPFAIQYLYARSFYPTMAIPKNTQFVIDYYIGQSKKYWNFQNLYSQGMMSLVLYKHNEVKTVKDMLKSFNERAFRNEEKGMYWENTNTYNWYWYDMPIETQSLMIEVYDQVAKDAKTVDELKIWLLKNKQTNSWSNTKSTAAAIYALLATSGQELEIPKIPNIKIGGAPVTINENEIEQGIGYVKKAWNERDINKNLAYIEVSNPNKNIVWGACYWQYLETLNHITSFKNTPLKIEKALFKVILTEKGERLEPIESSTITPGDNIRVKITLMIDREMEYLHLKDMRASGFEPVDVLSGYKWSNGLGFYQTNKDASMNFYIDRAQKGTYILEYDLRANLKGVFSNGITTLQSMYAPEFTSHSQGQEVKIK